MTTYTLTAETDINALVSAVDMRGEIASAFARGYESEAELAKGDGVTMVYFPECGRGGVCDNGQTQWIDCTGLDDLAAKWADAANHEWNR